MAQRTSDGGTRYHVSDPSGNHVVISGIAPQTGAGPSTLRFDRGGNMIILSQQNIIDLLPALTAFANTGVWS
jgi:hypothetical protein